MTSSSLGVNTLGIIISISFTCIIGVFANVIVIIVTLRKRDYAKSATNIFIINLAISDVILSGVTMPLILMDANISDFTNHDWECKLKMALPLFNIMSSITTMAALSFERMRSIVQQKNYTINQSHVAVLIIWMTSLLLTAPQLYEYGTVEVWEDEYNRTDLDCSSAAANPMFVLVYASIVLVMAYILPLVLIFRNYLHIFVVVLQKANRMQGALSKIKLRVLRMLVVTAVAFALLWLPYFVLFAIEEVTGTDNSEQASSTPHMVKHIFISISGLSNPIVYFSLSPEFRRDVLPLCCPAHWCVNKTSPTGQVRETSAYVIPSRGLKSKAEMGVSDSIRSNSRSL